MSAAGAGAGGAQALAERVVAGMLARDAFSRWLGVELVAVGAGTATVRMTVRPEMLNGHGVAHGGITFSLADSAFAFASNSHGRVALSVDTQVAHVRAVRAGDVLEAQAIEEHLGGRLACYRVPVTCEGMPVALFRGTVYRTKDPHPDES